MGLCVRNPIDEFLPLTSAHDMEERCHCEKPEATKQSLFQTKIASLHSQRPNSSDNLLIQSVHLRRRVTHDLAAFLFRKIAKAFSHNLLRTRERGCGMWVVRRPHNVVRTVTMQ